MLRRTRTREAEGADSSPGDDEEAASIQPVARARRGWRDEGQRDRQTNEEREEETTRHRSAALAKTIATSSAPQTLALRSAGSLGCAFGNLEAVAGAAHGFEVARRLGVGFDLLADAADVDVDRARGDEAGVAPDGVEEVVAAEDAAGMAGEVVEQTELGGGGGDELAVDAQLHGAGVDLDLLELDERRACWAARSGAARP